MFSVPNDITRVILGTLFAADLVTSIEKIKIKAGRKNRNNTINLGRQKYVIRH